MADRHPGELGSRVLDRDHRAADAAVAQVEIVKAEHRGAGHPGHHAFDLVGQRHPPGGIDVVLGEQDDRTGRRVRGPIQYSIEGHAGGVGDLQPVLPGRELSPDILGDLEVGGAAARDHQHMPGVGEQVQRPFQSAGNVEPVEHADDLSAAALLGGQRAVLDRDHRRAGREHPAALQQERECRLLNRDDEVDPASAIFLHQRVGQLVAVAGDGGVALEVEIFGENVGDRKAFGGDGPEETVAEQLDAASAVAVSVKQQDVLVGVGLDVDMIGTGG